MLSRCRCPLTAGQQEPTPNCTFACCRQTQNAEIWVLITKTSRVLSTPRPHLLKGHTAQNNKCLVKCKEEKSPILHQRRSGYIIASAENSPLKPKPSVWRSSVGDKVHFGCRPCCAEALSALHPGYSLWTPSQKQSAVKSKRVA